MSNALLHLLGKDWAGLAMALAVAAIGILMLCSGRPAAQAPWRPGSAALAAIEGVRLVVGFRMPEMPCHAPCSQQRREYALQPAGLGFRPSSAMRHRLAMRLLHSRNLSATLALRKRRS